ncbi:MAG: filamentation induced by cAMP protein Fic [Candidatus Magnetoglobus multicellularis str. Araruama]|uniref:Filamentation induced by cAMP protein Fic n=1 Tax=Candidatus Magnetoglobus multicellularis str. Araruama TaxID=890399 RepID=A0A1V1P1W0_9BACT|nr:MAG: filamentation induced by cAMP protein Fic [Candidatus Magnetoglobus multicellularis str. Araruama]
MLLVDDLKTQIESKKSLQNEHWEAIQEKLRVDWTYNSNAIEGSSLTKGETLFFLKEGLTVEGKPFKDFLDARNHAEAIDWLYEVIKDNRPISQGLIKEMNALLLSGVKYTPAIDQSGHKIRKPANPGKYKILPNHVLQTDGTIHFYTDPIHVADEMETLCKWINEKIVNKHPVIVASIAHYNMVRIHPFDDGNGRGARILMNLILIKKSYPVAIIRNENRRKYLTALNQADKGDIVPFLAVVSDSMIDTEKTIINELNGLSTY